MTSSRRKFLKQIGVAGAAIAGSSFFTSRVSAESLNFQPGFGKLVITKKGPVTIHTYIAPEVSALVTSHIVETNNALVMIDAQMVQPAVAELKAYIATLGKPLERIILSHEHPDHWLGSGQFDVPYVSTPAVAEAVAIGYDATLERMSNTLGEAMPTGARVPEGSASTGSEIIDDVEMIFDVFNDAEAPEHLVIRIPDAATVITQDLIYNNAHFFPLGNNNNWVAILNTMRSWADDGYDTLLAGHGMPGSFGELDEAITYLGIQDEILSNATSADEATAELTERYPSYGGSALLGFVALRFQ